MVNMRHKKRRVLTNPEQISDLKRLGFYFERSGVADCIVPGDRTPSIKPTDIYMGKGEIGLRLMLIITDAGSGIFPVINREDLHKNFHYEPKSIVSEYDILRIVRKYLKDHGYEVSEKKE